MDYPLEQAILSAAEFSDEVCVFDTSDEGDETREKLRELASKNSKVKVKFSNEFDWSAPNHGTFDGKTKQKAREMCRSSFLWQFDIDEIVHEDHIKLIPDIITKNKDWSKAPIIALPVVEFWGRNGKVRIDVNVWKPRLSINSPNIVHGIPLSLRTTDPETGLQYAKHGTDTCDYINKVTGLNYPIVTFLTEDVRKLQDAARRDSRAAAEFQKWYEHTLTALPGVFHYSWFNIERKIIQYRLFWTKFWKAMYNETRDERENPFFPGLLWSEVSDEMIRQKAKELEEKTGGWVFHRPWDGSSVRSISVSMDHPKIIQSWVKEHM